MRSYREVGFRIRQELANAFMFLLPPRACSDMALPLLIFPKPQTIVPHLRNTGYAAEVERIADQLLAHNYPLLGTSVQLGPEIAWRRDYVSGIESGLRYFRFIQFLDPHRVGNHKIVSELNRHQHLVLLAQAYLLTGRCEMLDTIHCQLQSWLDDNPFARSFNWTSALEVAFRALSWIWVLHWTGTEMPPPLRRRVLNSLYQHGCFIEQNLSVFFSANTHLLGEAVALHLLGRAFPAWPRASAWEDRGHRIVVEHMQDRVRDDGGYHEQSIHYHVYATDFFLLHKLMARSTPAAYDVRLQKMAELLDALMGSGDSLPAIGDDDGGRIFHPYGPRTEFARATLATSAAVYDRPEWLRRCEDRHEIAAWWIGQAAFEITPKPPISRPSRVFRATGLAVLRARDLCVVADVGPFGPDASAHSHSDTLSITAAVGNDEVLIDAGTCTYVDQVWRDRFRGSAGHNTVRVNGRNQGQTANPFRWSSIPEVSLRRWESDSRRDLLDAECRYSGVVHRRVLVLTRSQLCLFVVDVVTGPEGEHVVEQFWHPGQRVQEIQIAQFQIGSRSTLVFPIGTEADISTGGQYGWRSRALEHREPAPVLKITRRGTFPAILTAVIDFSGNPPMELRTYSDGRLEYGEASVRLPVEGVASGGSVEAELGSACYHDR